MKRLTSILVVLLVSLSGLAQPLTQWTLQRAGDTQTFSVTVPSTVAGALNEAGYWGQDILDQNRYASLDKSIFDSPWTYTTTFEAAKGMSHVLRFEGLNFYADIDLNGKRIASADTTYGAFSVREIDITALAKRKNTLTVTVRRAQKGDLNHGYVDWNPRPLDESMGIIRPVILISTPDVQVQDVYVRPEVNPEQLSEAGLLVNCLVVNRSSHAVAGTLRGVYEGGAFELPVTLQAGETRKVEVKEQVKNPRIWWTAEMGKPELYHMEVSFCKGQAVSHSKKVTFGIRDIKGIVDAKGHRQFILNGRPVLIKAGGWTDDIFMQDTPKSLKAQLDMVHDMGLNTIRFENIWGKDDTVYDLCDEMGILALVGWSCQWEWEDYCGLPETKGYGCINDPHSEAVAVRYFHDQVIRLRNHASVCGWLTGSDRIPNPRLEEQYLKLYKELDYRPYVCSAKGITSLEGPSGMKMEGPYEYVGPDYWWIDTKCGGAFGFNTETSPGFNVPQEESLRRMVGEKDLWPIGPNWAYHCTASSSHMHNTAFLEAAMEGVYGKATDLKDFIRKAHALEYDAERSMYEAFRGNVPNATGIVQWMLNSAWPSMYWQLYDWYGIPTSGYYGTKTANKPVQLVYNYADHGVWVVNDVVPEAKVKARLRVYDVNCKLLREETVELTSNARQPKKVFEGVDGPCFVALKLSGDYSAKNFYCIPEKGNDYNWKKADWWGIPFNGFCDLSWVSALPEAKIKLTVAPARGGYDITVENKSDVIAYMNIIKARAADGSLIPGVFYSDNFFTLTPYDKQTIHCSVPKGTPTPDFDLVGWNAAVEQDPLDRAQSKYATYSFSLNDQYIVENPYQAVTVQQPKGKKIKNVIFMIGDGMGSEQVSVGWVANGGQLNMTQMPVLGASRTYCLDRLVTDSCAGGAALACGQKTKYGYIAVDENQQPMESSLHVARKKGMKTGVAVTCRINDATPADFCVNGPSRKDEEGLAAKYVGSGVDFISGGGLHFWTQRSDGRNLVEEMKALGYTFVDKLEDIAGAQGDRFLGLYGEYDLDPCLDRGPILLESTKKAIQMLDNPKGFFLMVEGSQIDDYAHRNKCGQMVEELFDFDKTIGYVLEWAARDGQTLVIVTADHCTGGVTLLKGSIEDHQVKVNFSTSGHDGIVVPVFAFGPGAENFAGIHENSEIGQIVKDLLK